MDTSDTGNIQGYIFFDEQCAFCCGWVMRLHPMMLNTGLHFVPMQAAWAMKKLGVTSPGQIGEMKLLAADGRVFGAVDAWIEITKAVWFLYPISILLRLPGLHFLAGKAYQKIAKNRQCISGFCKVFPRTQRGDGYAKRVFMDLPD